MFGSAKIKREFPYNGTMRAPGETRTNARRSLTTERLLLREWEEEDWQPVHRIYADPEVSRYSAHSLSMEEATARKFAREMAAARDTPFPHGFVIVLRESGAVIGSCRLARLREGNGQGDIAYYLESRFWNQGYGTEVARALLEYGFMDFGMHRISASCHPDNIASWRILEKIGMRREALHRFNTWNWQTEEWNDRFEYAILEDEWLGLPITNVEKPQAETSHED